MAIEDDLNQNILILTQAVNSLNQNMFGSTGGRPGMLGGSSRPGQGVNLNDPQKDAIKQLAATTLLEKRMKENSETIKFLIKNQKESMKNLSQYTATASKYFENALQKFSAQQLNKQIPDQLTAMFKDAINQGFVNEMKSYEDVLRLTRRVQADNVDQAYEYLKQLQGMGDTTTLTASQLEDLTKKMNDTGWEFDDLQAALDKCGGNVDKLKEQMGGISAKMAETAAATERQTIASNAAAKALGVLGSAAMAVGALYLNSARSAAQYGTTFDGVITSIKNATLAGLNPEDLARLQHEQHQALNAGNISMENFQKRLVSGSWDLLEFTGSLAEGAKLTASFIGTFSSLSNNMAERDKFLAEQAQIFKTMNRTFSVTAEEFTGLNSMLQQSHDVQVSMYKLNRDQRVANFKDLQMSYARLRSYGLLDEEAKKVVQSLAQISGKTAKDRFVQAARIQAIGGALGMGGEAAELAQLVRRGQAGSARGVELATILQRGTSGRYQAAGRGGVGEFALDALVDIAPEIFGAQAPTAALAISQGREMGAAREAQLAQSSFVGGGEFHKETLVHLMGIQDAVTTTGANTVKAILLAAGGGAIGGLVAKGLGKAIGAGRIAGGLAGGGALAATGTALGVASAGVLGYGVGTAINKTLLTDKKSGANKIVDFMFRNEEEKQEKAYQEALAKERVKRFSSAIDAKTAELRQGGVTPAEQAQIDYYEGLKKELVDLKGAFGEENAKLLQELRNLTRTTKNAAEMNMIQTDEQTKAMKQFRWEGRRNTIAPPV